MSAFIVVVVVVVLVLVASPFVSLCLLMKSLFFLFFCVFLWLCDKK